MTERRSVYFAFQGLLMAVLLLIFLYQYKEIHGWLPRFYFLMTAMVVSLVWLEVAPAETLNKWMFDAGLFIGDAVLTSLTLLWTQPQSDLYLMYFLIIFGTALTRDIGKSVLVAAVCSALYLISAWHPLRAFPHSTAFWLRFMFLWVTTFLMAILSRDTEQAQSEERRKYQARLVHVGRLATLGQIAGEVAHQIKGPLTTIMVNAEVLALRHSKSKEILKELTEIQEEVTHCKQILQNLLNLGRIEEMDLALIDLRDAVRQALQSVEPQMRKHGIRKKVTGLDSPRLVLGDQSLLQEAVTAILQNAVDATKRGGHITLAVTERSLSAWPRLESETYAYDLSIEDDGEGIEPEALERIFEPFFTTKGAEGSGLGLSASLRILQKHDGSVEAYSAGRGLGARFTITIPKAEKSPSAAPPR